LKVPSQQFPDEKACSRDVLGMQQVPPSPHISPGPQPSAGQACPCVLFGAHDPDESSPVQHDALLTTPADWGLQ
jgi:hypothetical protein